MGSATRYAGVGGKCVRHIGAGCGEGCDGCRALLGGGAGTPIEYIRRNVTLVSGLGDHHITRDLTPICIRIGLITYIRNAYLTRPIEHIKAIVNIVQYPIPVCIRWR